MYKTNKDVDLMYNNNFTDMIIDTIISYLAFSKDMVHFADDYETYGGSKCFELKQFYLVSGPIKNAEGLGPFYYIVKDAILKYKEIDVTVKSSFDEKFVVINDEKKTLKEKLVRKDYLNYVMPETGDVRIVH
eukprot:UN27255